MNPNTKNTITNIIAFLLVLLEPVNSYLNTQEFNWSTFLVCIGGAVIGWFTGKKTNEVSKP
jgi:hypothetical protein